MARTTNEPNEEVLPDPVPAAVAEPETLTLSKDGESISVHKTAVQHYLSAGWKVV